MRLVRMAAVAVALALGMAIGGGGAVTATNGCAETRNEFEMELNLYDALLDEAASRWNPAWEEEQPPIQDEAYQVYIGLLRAADEHYSHADMWMQVWYENNCHLM